MPLTPFIGMVIPWGPNFAPRGWALCEGQLLAVSQFDALFAILGTTYGGDGRTTFGLPDLRGRVAIQPGQGPGLSDYRLGTQGGRETVTPTLAQLPAHAHAVAGGPSIEVVATTDEGDQTEPTAAHRLAAGKLARGHDVDLYSDLAPNTKLGGLRVDGSYPTASVGGGGAHENRQPALAVHYIIALQGVFPTRT